jgi:hypothetical protein
MRQQRRARVTVIGRMPEGSGIDSTPESPPGFGRYGSGLRIR